MLKSQCAPSSSPVRILSRTLAHDASFDTSTFRPYFLKKPSSFAITIGAQSVSGINPILITSPLPDPDPFASLLLTLTGAAAASNNRKTGATQNVNILFIY